MKLLWSTGENDKKKVRCNERMDFCVCVFQKKKHQKTQPTQSVILHGIFQLSIKVSLWQKIRETYHERMTFRKGSFITLRNTFCCGSQGENNIHTYSLDIFLCV